MSSMISQIASILKRSLDPWRTGLSGDADDRLTIACLKGLARK